MTQGKAPHESTLQIDDIDVFLEGEGNETIVMIPGWPDTVQEACSGQ
jgi:hypothetical protein